MVAVAVQALRQAQHLGRAGLHAEPATLTFFGVHLDRAAVGFAGHYHGCLPAISTTSSWCLHPTSLYIQDKQISIATIKKTREEELGMCAGALYTENPHAPARAGSGRRNVMTRRGIILGAFSRAVLAQSQEEYVCPMDPEVRAAKPGRCPRCGMALVAGLPEPLEYPVDVRMAPAAPRAGQRVQLSFTVRHPKTGARVRSSRWYTRNSTTCLS